MVLVRRAAALRLKASLGTWLYAVAQRVAARARAQTLGRRERERRVEPRQPRGPLDELIWQELRGVLDAEIAKLPEKYQAPLVLCYLEGKSQEQAAKELGWPKSSLTRRIERARELLRERLVRRGVALSAAALATALCEKVSGAPVAAMLVINTVKAASGIIAGKVVAGGCLSVRALALAEEAAAGIVAIKAKLLVMVLVLGVGGAGLAGYAGLSGNQQPAKIHDAQTPPARIDKGARQMKDKPVATDQYGDPLPPGAVARLGTLRFRHEGDARNLVFTSDGKTLVGDTSSGIIVWNVANGQELHRLPAEYPPHGLRRLDVSPDASKLALLDNTFAERSVQISLWNLRTGTKTRTISLTRPDGRNKRIGQLRFAPDGKTLVLTSLDDVLLLDVDAGKVRASFESSPAAIFDFAVSPDCQALALALATAKDKSSVQLWDFATGKLIRRIHDADSVITALTFSADGKKLAFSRKDSIFLSETETGKELGRLPTQMGKFGNLAFAPDGQTLLSHVEDAGQVVVWDVATGKVRHSLDCRTTPARSMALSVDGKTVAVGGRASTVRLWDVATGKELFSELQGHDSQINCLAFSPDGKTLVSGGDYQQIRVWDTAHWIQTHLFQGSAKTLSFCPDGQRLATVPGLFGKTVRVWDVAKGQEQLTISVPDTVDVLTAVFSLDGRKIFTLDRKGDMGADSSGVYRLQRWDTATGKEDQWWALPAKMDPLLIAPNGISVIGRGTGTIPIFDAQLGRERLFRWDEKDDLWALALSSDGRLLASGVRTPNYTVRLWEMATGKEVLLLEGHAWPVSAIAWSPDGRILATGDQRNDRVSSSPDGRMMVGWDASARDKSPTNQTVRLWDTVSGKELARFGDFKADVVTLTFSPDGAYVAAGLRNSTILIWEAGKVADRTVAQKIAMEDLEARWADLAGEDAPKAHQAIWSLVAAAQQSLPMLRDRLKPVAAADPGKVKQWIADLSSDNFLVRQGAAKQLEKLGEQVIPPIRSALKGNPSLESRRRLELILKALSDVPAFNTLRALRAIAVLEKVGSAEAQAVLEVLAGGAAGARETADAKAALERLGGRQP